MQVKTVQHGQRRARREEPRHGRAGVRAARRLSERRADRKSRGHVGDFLSRAARRRVLPRAQRRSFEGRRCRCSRRRTGAGRDCTRAATSKASRAPLRSRSGWRCTAARTGRRSTPTTASTLQKRFFDHFLKGKPNGWDKQPRVLLKVRHPGEKFVQRHENEWPLARTQWTRFYLDPKDDTLSQRAGRGRGKRRPTTPWATASRSPRRRSEGDRDHRTFGAQALRLLVDTSDADVFAVLRVFDPQRKGGRVPGRARSAHAGRAGMAARLAPQARSEALAAVPALAHARRAAAARRRASRSSSTSRSGRPASSCPRATASRSRSAAGTTSTTMPRRSALEHEEPDARLRAVRARRPDRPTARSLRRQGDAAFRSAILTCCFRSFPRNRGRP